MPMTDQEAAEFKQQMNDLLQGAMQQRNAAMDEQVNLGAIIRATSRERDALKAQVAQLTEQIAKLTAPAPVASSLPAGAMDSVSPAALAAATPIANGAAQPSA